MPATRAPKVKKAPYFGARRREGNPASPIASAIVGLPSPDSCLASWSIRNASLVLLAVVATLATSAPRSLIEDTSRFRSSQDPVRS